VQCSLLIFCVVLAHAQSQPAPVPQPSNATPSEPQQPKELPEVEETVVVTATRANRRLQDEPLRVEVIDREEIEEKALMTPGSVAMLLGETTGLRVQTTAPSIGAANVRIQGLRGRYAQLLADGLPLYGASGDSFSMLQVPPLDLGQVEIIKGAASALYGSAALGGVINLVSRRPVEDEREALINVTSQRGADATFWLAEEPRAGWSWTLLSGFHGQPRRDLDADGWTDLAGYKRAAVRPRVFFENGRGGSLFVTGGVIVEDREGGTLPGGLAPDGQPFAEALDTRRGDLGALTRWLLRDKVISVRGSYARLRQVREFGDVSERGTRHTWFGETSISGTTGRHTWVVGGAFQQDRYAPRDVVGFDYRFSSPALFLQDEITLGALASVSGSARIDFHSEYGTLASPRVSLLLRPSSQWTARISAGGGSFAPTPFTEETDETGLARLAPLAGLEAERAWTSSGDLTWTRGPFEISGTLFGSVVKNAVQLVDAEGRGVTIATGGRGFSPTTDPTVQLLNAPESTRTWGTELIARYRRGEFIAMATHAYTRSTEFDFDRGGRREVPLTPRHAASFNVMIEGDEWGRLGFEAYYTGRQRLEDNPYRDISRRYLLFGGLFERRLGVARLFINVENLADIRQTKYDPLIRPTRLPDGRWTVDAWGPLDGRVWNGGVRVSF
jgi:outer membrane receptor for ferrienterochelin and colicins